MLTLALALAPVYSHANNQSDDGSSSGDAGVVFTMDNAATANHVLSYHRRADGKLEPAGAFATGGRGTGSGLGSQGAVVLSDNGRWLLVCNAGSDEISVFLVVPQGLVLSHTIWSGGKHPISLALHKNSLFVLNAGGQVGDQDNVTGFVFFEGRLYPLPGTTHGLSAASTNPAQVGFSSDGNVLVVTEKDTGVIDTFTFDNDGSIAEANHFQSSGQTPFGFAVHGNDLFVSEAFGGAPDASALSSYVLYQNGELEGISPSVPTTESSACWVAVTKNGRFAYTANTGSGTLSSFAVARNGTLTRLDSDGVTGVTGAGSSPADLAMSVNSRYLYSRNGNGTISAFRVNPDGALTALEGVSGLPTGTTGLAAH